MKIRGGFVSNSSSESFTCDVCKETVSGMDMRLSDAEMYRCVNNHTFCEDHWEGDIDDLVENLIKEKKTGTDLDNMSEDDEEYESEKEYYTDDLRYNVPTSICPICTLKAPCERVVLDFALLKLGHKYDDMFKILQEEFKDFDSLQDAIKDVRD
jgi:hypothetical protein